MPRRRKHVKMPEATINLTSLLDITFVLLIAFMIVAPALKYAVELELPEVKKTSRPSEQKPVTLQVSWSERAGSGFHVNGTQMLLEEVPEAIRALTPYGEEPTVALEADRSAPWEDVARLINELKQSEINNVGIITRRES